MTLLSTLQLERVATIEVPGPPIAHRLEYSRRNKRFHRTTEYKNYVERIESIADAYVLTHPEKKWPVKGAFVVRFEFRFYDKTGKKPWLHIDVPDFENLCKPQLDGVKRRLISEDRRVCGYLDSLKMWVHSPEKEGTTVSIYRVVDQPNLSMDNCDK